MPTCPNSASPAAALQYVSGDSGVLYPMPIGNHYASVTITSAGGTTPVTILTGAPGYFLTEIGVQVDDITTIGTAGMVSLTFNDTSFGNMAVFRWYLPVAFAAKNGPQNNRVTNGPGFAWNNKTANSSLQVSTDTALTAGSLRFFARYALSNVVG